MEKNKNYFISSKRGQLTIFIIIGIVIVAAIALFFAFQIGYIGSSVPEKYKPVYEYYLSCIDEEARIGSQLLGHSGGYIDLPEFSPGSQYMPFSSQLNFFGEGVPYWYYISGNGLVKEQVPTKANMEAQLNFFLSKRIPNCDFSNFQEEGFSIVLGRAESVETKINDNTISLEVKQPITISSDESESWSSTSHSRSIKTNLGKFYKTAMKIYKKQKEGMFLENYAVDTLRLYAPVDGNEIGCSPKIWKKEDVRQDLIGALEANVPFTKVSGNYYELSKEDNKYFIVDIDEKVDSNVNFMYSRNWPMKFEVYPSEEGLMMAEPVGNQEGMGMLGFCYVAYHFVYDLAYPVLVQVYYEDELFQFPVVVSINKNKPREPLNGSAMPDSVPELCKYKTKKMTVYTYNNDLEPVNANIDFKCLATSCNIGKTVMSRNSSDSVLIANFPQCVNGFIVASSPGYKTEKYMVTSLNEDNIQIVMQKKYKLNINLQNLGSEDYSLITFTKDKESFSISYPEQKEIEISEGQYEIKAYVYSNSSISLEGTNEHKCVDVPKEGILGAFGMSEQKCFNLEIPEQIVSSAVSGGGKSNYYISESELKNSKILNIIPQTFGIPNKVEDIQLNFNSVENTILSISFE
ncbi:MAG: hypothetical protein WC867_06175 [Candidatus Pacearchaeota archaeon]|jgi:hypothetical protein